MSDKVKKFKSFGVPGILKHEQKKIDSLFGVNIIVHRATFRRSQFHNQKYAKILFSCPESPQDEKYVCFTESETVVDQLKDERVEYPFSTIIKKQGRSIYLT